MAATTLRSISDGAGCWLLRPVSQIAPAALSDVAPATDPDSCAAECMRQAFEQFSIVLLQPPQPPAGSSPSAECYCINAPAISADRAAPSNACRQTSSFGPVGLRDPTATDDSIVVFIRPTRPNPTRTTVTSPSTNIQGTPPKSATDPIAANTETQVVGGTSLGSPGAKPSQVTLQSGAWTSSATVPLNPSAAASTTTAQDASTGSSATVRPPDAGNPSGNSTHSPFSLGAVVGVVAAVGVASICILGALVYRRQLLVRRQAAMKSKDATTSEDPSDEDDDDVEDGGGAGGVDSGDDDERRRQGQADEESGASRPHSTSPNT